MKQIPGVLIVLAIVCIGLAILHIRLRPSVRPQDNDFVSRHIEERYGKEIADASAEFKARTDGFREDAGDKLIQVLKAKTPQVEVERLFGKPGNISDSPDGKRWMYVTGYSKAIFVAFDSNDNVKAVDRLPKHDSPISNP